MTNRILDEEAIFHIARDLMDKEKRAEYLDQICDRDAALRDRVEALFDTHDNEGNFLKPNADVTETADFASIGETGGEQIGGTSCCRAKRQTGRRFPPPPLQLLEIQKVANS